MDKIVCIENENTISNLLDKIKELNVCCEFSNSFTTTMNEGAVIRATIVGSRVFITDDGSEPTPVLFVDADPIETYLMGQEMDRIFFNRVNVSEMYLNGVIIFYKTMYLELPQYPDGVIIDLAKFINENNPDNTRKVIVVNNHIQPSLRTHSLLHLRVTLINNGEFQGTSPSSDAFIIDSPIKLINNGWIKGAGGNGLAGVSAPAPYGWIVNKTLYDGSWCWACGQPGCPSHYMQFPTGVVFAQTTTGGAKQVWSGSGFQGHVLNNGPFTIWGEAGWFRGVYKKTMIGQCGTPFEWWSLEKKVWGRIPAGKGGSRGIGQNFNQTNSMSGTAGTTVNGTTGTSGTNGGTWGQAGVGVGAGVAGRAIVGSANIIAFGSIQGNTIGAIS